MPKNTQDHEMAQSVIWLNYRMEKELRLQLLIPEFRWSLA